MGIATYSYNRSTSGGEIIRELVNATDGQGLHFANGAALLLAYASGGVFGTADFSIEFILDQDADNSSDNEIYTSQIAGSNVLKVTNSISSNVVRISFDSTNYDIAYDMSGDYGTPTHYVLTCDRSALATLYKNGNSVGTIDISGSSAVNLGNGNTANGYLGGVSGYGVIGTYYRWRTWKKLLSSAEVTACYENASVPITDQWSNCVTDLDLAFANPEMSLQIQCRSGAGDATASVGVSQVTPIEAVNTNKLSVGGTTPRVGIGLAAGTAAGHPLHVKAAGTGNAVFVEASDGSQLAGIYQESDGRAALNVRDAGGDPKINLDSGGVSYFKGGHVGVGVTPVTPLQVNGAAGFNLCVDHESGSVRAIALNDAGNTFVPIAVGGSTVQLRTGASQAAALIIDSAGDVMIGSGTAERKLHIKDALAANNTVACKIENTGTGFAGLDLATDGTDWSMLAWGSGTGTPNQLSFSIGTTHPLTISNAGSVKVETNISGAQPYTDAHAGLLIENAHASGAAILRMRGGNGIAHILYGENNSTDRLHIAPRNAAEKAIIFDQNAVATFPSGIAFTQTNTAATGAAESSTNLNHFEVGTWTPVVQDSAGNAATTSVANGTYTRIGNRVLVAFAVTITSIGSMTGAYVQIKGIPFPHPDNDWNGGGTIPTFQNFDTSYASLALDSASTTTVFWLVGVPAGGGGTSVWVPVSALSGNERFAGQAQYYV